MAIVGIDLGTTNSLIACFKDGQPHLIPNALGEKLTPSAVSLDESGTILVGRAARERLITHPGDSVGQFKRFMGSRKVFQLRGKNFLPEELSALVLRALKQDAEAFLGEPVVEAVISVPAYFNDAQRKATRAAGQLAGFKVERLINEPTAAAIAYGLPNIGKESTFFVFDLGGGTFDVSILELFDGTMEVHAACGDNYLGGDDFDLAIADSFLAGHKLPREKLDAGTEGRLKSRAEQLKIRLSREKSGRISLEHEGRTLEWSLDREGFELLSKPLLQRLRIPVEKALRDSRLKTSDLDAVILVGGSTRIPFVRHLVARLFGRIPDTHLDPDEVIALGAGLAAAMKQQHQDLKEVVMTDVCPYTLGIGIVRQLNDGAYQPGHFLPVIERNTTVPVSRSEFVNPVTGNQTVLEVEVFQGESRLVSNNVRLGMIRVPLPKGTKEELQVEIRFTYDINGLLEVEATVLKTGVKVAVVIEENPGVLSKEEIETRFQNLSKLKIHPRDQAENRALMAKAERLYEESLGGLREYLGVEISAFSNVIDGQNPDAIKDARQRLVSALGNAEEEGRILLNPWEILEIPATRDLRTVKKAYTRLLRKFPPESDPEGFKRLRQAYDVASALAKMPDWTVEPGENGAAEQDGGESPGIGDDLGSIREETSSDSTFEDSLPESVDTFRLPSVTAAMPLEGWTDGLQEPSAPVLEAQGILAKIEKEFPDHGKRQSTSYWREMVDAEALWSLDAKAFLGHNLFLFLAGKISDARGAATEVHIPKEAWILLDGTFGWIENETALYSSFPEALVDAVLDPIRSAKGQKMAVELATSGSSLLIDEERPRSFRWLRLLPLILILIIQILKQCER